MLQIHMIPAFNDNYFWLIQPNRQSAETYVVDPGSAQPVFEYLHQHKLHLKGILITHHHQDHIGGANDLSKHYNIPICGPKSPRIPQITRFLGEGDTLHLPPLTIRVIEIPGHTLDHIAYFVEAPDTPPLLFSGDTIFGVGCGRLFDGTASLLHKALRKIAALPDATLIYAGHEYTLANIQFALTIEPENEDLKIRQQTEIHKREMGLATLPTQLALEKRTNPFLRCHLNSIHSAVEKISSKAFASEADVFASLRLIKDRF